MFKNIKNLILHDLVYIISNRNLIYIFMIVSVCLVSNFAFKINGVDLNLWDLYGGVFMNSMIIPYVPCIVSIYFSALIFFDSEINTFIKIRVSSKRQWYISKILTIFIFNLFTILILTLITLIIGTVFFGISNTWSESSIIAANKTPMYFLDFKYVNFYSPIKLILINSIIFSTFMSIIGLVSSLIAILFNKPKLGILLPVIYILISLISKNVSNNILKYVIYQNYILFGQRNYYNVDLSSELYLTVNEAFFIPIILLILTIILGIIIIKKIDFTIGEKRLWI